jgi:hypothetical protein
MNLFTWFFGSKQRAAIQSSMTDWATIQLFNFTNLTADPTI